MGGTIIGISVFPRKPEIEFIGSTHVILLTSGIIISLFNPSSPLVRPSFCCPEVKIIRAAFTVSFCLPHVLTIFCYLTHHHRYALLGTPQQQRTISLTRIPRYFVLKSPAGYFATDFTTCRDAHQTYRQPRHWPLLTTRIKLVPSPTGALSSCPHSG